MKWTVRHQEHIFLSTFEPLEEPPQIFVLFQIFGYVFRYHTVHYWMTIFHGILYVG